MISVSSKQCVLDNDKESILARLKSTSAEMKSLENLVSRKQLVLKRDVANEKDSLLSLVAVGGLPLENFARYFMLTTCNFSSLMLLLLGDIRITRCRQPD